MSRVVFIVLDGVGVGALPDAADYGDAGSDTLGNLSRVVDLRLPDQSGLKLITALKGTREERAILIRDPNRLVAMGVLGSPKITEAEIESFSAMKNVSDQVLRHIGNHREWTKNYAVINNLVRNPRTPIGIALNLVPRLSPRDIKGISVDRNVPEAVRKQAQKFVKGAQAR